MRREKVKENVIERIEYDGWVHEDNVAKIDLDIEGHLDSEAYLHSSTGQILFAGRRKSDSKGRWFVVKVPSNSPVWETSGLVNSLPLLTGKINLQVNNTNDIMQDVGGPFDSRDTAMDYIYKKIQ